MRKRVPYSILSNLSDGKKLMHMTQNPNKSEEKNSTPSGFHRSEVRNVRSVTYEKLRYVIKCSSLHVVIDFKVWNADVVLAAFLVDGSRVRDGSQVLTRIDDLKSGLTAW